MVAVQSCMEGIPIYNMGGGRCIHLNSPGVGVLAKTMSHYFIKKIVEVIIIILTLPFVVIASNM